MADLADAFSTAGCKNVRTYIQTGNVVFDCSGGASGTLFRKIRAEVRNLVGGNPDVMFRTIAELESILKAAPFKLYENDSLIKQYVVFLSEKPRLQPELPLVSSREALEAIGITGLDAFIVSRRKPNGFYGFPNNFIEKELGVSATTRNWSTVTKVVEFARRMQC
jgi:uncharacterized protein (DUF1697 family)